MFLHSIFSDFSRAARRVLQPLPGIGQAAGALPVPDAATTMESSTRPSTT